MKNEHDVFVQGLRTAVLPDYNMMIRSISSAAQNQNEQQKPKQNDKELVELVYFFINRHSGHVTKRDINKVTGNEKLAAKAIELLRKEGKIKSIKGFGKHRIEYFYHDVAQL